MKKRYLFFTSLLFCSLILIIPRLTYGQNDLYSIDTIKNARGGIHGDNMTNWYNDIINANIKDSRIIYSISTLEERGFQNYNGEFFFILSDSSFYNLKIDSNKILSNTKLIKKLDYNNCIDSLLSEMKVDNYFFISNIKNPVKKYLHRYFIVQNHINDVIYTYDFKSSPNISYEKRILILEKVKSFRGFYSYFRRLQSSYL